MPALITHDFFGQDVYDHIFRNVGGTRDEAEAFLLDKSLDPNPVRNAIAAWVEKTGIPGQVYTYASPEATCTMTETLVADGYYPTYRGVYPDGTARPQAEFEKNEDRWWLDDYYTK